MDTKSPKRPTEAAGVDPADSDALVFPANTVQDAIEYCFRQGWTDGLPVVPCTEQLLEPFLAYTERAPDDVVLEIPHLSRRCTVQLAAINAVMAGCLPEYFPTVLAAWDSLDREGHVSTGIWQSTTGTAPLLLVNGPVRCQIGLNSAGNVFGSGSRANAAIGRAIRLAAINVFGLVPGVLDQATQATPAKYSCCIGENEAASPWPGFQEDHGFSADDSTVTAMIMRSTVHIEARHASKPEQLLHDVANSVCRTGALLRDNSCCIVFCPEHAELIARGGWSKPDVREFIHSHAVISPETLELVGKGGVSRISRWRVPVEHPDALTTNVDKPLHAMSGPASVHVIVAGAANAGVSTIVEMFGHRDEVPIASVISPSSTIIADTLS